MKIKLCMIGEQKSGKTYLINEYLKYHDFIIQKYIEHSENSPSDPVFEGNSESFSDNLPAKSRKSYTSSNSNVTELIKQKLREIKRFKSLAISEKILIGTNKNLANRDIELIVFVYDNEYPVEVQIWDQVDSNMPYYMS